MPQLIDPVLPEASGRVEDSLGQQLVDVSRPGHRYLRSWRIGEGVKAVSWLLDVEGADTVVAKFFRPESEERMARELGFHAACNLDDSRLPVLLGSREAIPDEQLGVVLTNCLMGQRLADDAGATEADKRLVYAQSSAFLRELHGLTMQGFGALGSPPEFASARAFAEAEVEHAIERRERVGGEAQMTRKIAAWARERAQSIDAAAPSVLCHGDFSMWNMLVEWRGGRHELTGIFDFESAYAGDALMELASAWVLTDSWGDPKPPELAAIERGYGEQRKQRADDFELYVAIQKLKLWWYYAERDAVAAAGDVSASLARQIGM